MFLSGNWNELTISVVDVCDVHVIYIGAHTQVHTPVGIVHRGSSTWITIEISVHSFTGDILGGPVGFLYGWSIMGQVITASWNQTIHDDGKI